MNCEHGSDNSRMRSRAMVASVHDPGPRQRFAQTFFAYMVVPKKICPWTKKSIIVKCLHNRNTHFLACPISRRRNHEKSVVKVCHLRFFAVKECREVSHGTARPDRPRRQTQFAPEAEGIDLVIGAQILYHLMPGATEQSCLLADDDIFTAGLLVRIMNNQNFHRSHAVLANSLGKALRADSR